RLESQTRREMGRVCTATARTVSEVLELTATARSLARELENRLSESCQDMGEQLDDLIYPGFLDELEPGRLEHHPRYLQALLHRLEKLKADPAQDLKKLNRVRPWWRRYRDHLLGGAVYDENVDAFRWLIAEFRVSVFAQHLGTVGKVSEKRLQEAWDRILQS
ncbi:MAG: DUF3418 domain-containing protein, partial [Xanthomonadales bacterium]|nr:DUF3418 domain-containing protein [Xanthomonadales bacterium]